MKDAIVNIVNSLLLRRLKGNLEWPRMISHLRVLGVSLQGSTTLIERSLLLALIRPIRNHEKDLAKIIAIFVPCSNAGSVAVNGRRALLQLSSLVS